MFIILMATAPIYFIVHTSISIHWLKQHGPNGKSASQEFLARNLSGRTVGGSFIFTSAGGKLQLTDFFSGLNAHGSTVCEC